MEPNENQRMRTNVRQPTAVVGEIGHRPGPIRRHRSTLGVLAVATAIGALGLAAGGSAGALLAEDMTGSTAWAGVPLGVLVLGSAASALLISQQTTRRGRGPALALGYALGASGAVLVIAAAIVEELPLLLAGSAALGAANAAIFLARYAAVDLGGEAGRGRALGLVFSATAFGAVASPNLLGPSGEVAERLGLPRLTGLYLVAVIAFVAAGLLLIALPRRTLSATSRDPVGREALRTGLRSANVALLVLGATNLVMVAVMAIAPIHMTAHDHGLGFVGVAIGVHVLCMFAPSPLTGWLADRAGSGLVAATGAMLLVAAGVSGVVLDLSDGTAMTVMLALLGLGWNAGIVGGSTMLAGSVTASLRPQTEGIGEVTMGLAAGVGAPAAGLVVALGNFAALSLAGALVAVLLLATLLLGERAPLPAS
jgi:MFS family permease